MSRWRCRHLCTLVLLALVCVRFRVPCSLLVHKSPCVLQMMHNLARLAGGALDGKDVQGAGDVGAPQERRPARKLGRGQGEGHVGSGAGGGKNKILFASSEGGNQQALDRDLPVAVGDSSHADGSVLRSRHDA